MEKESSESIIARVLTRFQEADNNQTKWTNLDTNMEYLSWLDDDQTIKETELVLDGHIRTNMRCKENHDDNQCFAPVIVRAVVYIITDYKIYRKLSEKNRYILEYYISLSKIGEIFPGSVQSKW